MKFVYRDYWNEEQNHNPYTDMIHDLNDRKVLQLNSALHHLYPDDLKDGDEIEITITKTGNRPFGDRRIVWQKAHTYGLETDEQMKERLNNQDDITG